MGTICIDEIKTRFVKIQNVRNFAFIKIVQSKFIQVNVVIVSCERFECCESTILFRHNWRWWSYSCLMRKRWTDCMCQWLVNVSDFICIKHIQRSSIRRRKMCAEDFLAMKHVHLSCRVWRRWLYLCSYSLFLSFLDFRCIFCVRFHFDIFREFYFN